MEQSSLSKKMKLKPGQNAAIINAPDRYLDELGPPASVTVSNQLKGKFDWIQIFVENQAELKKILPRVVKALDKEALLWISYPKGSSKIQTDLTRDRGWESVTTFDLKWINLISVNNTWSAFSLRPYRSGEARQHFR